MMKVTGVAADIFGFLGTPIIALAAGAICAIIQLKVAGKMAEFYDITNETLKTVMTLIMGVAAILEIFLLSLFLH